MYPRTDHIFLAGPTTYTLALSGPLLAAAEVPSTIKSIMNQSRKLYIMLLLLLIVFYTGGCITHSIIFPAPSSSYKDSSDIIKLESENGIVISAIYLPTDKAGFAVLYSHGNAEDLGHILPYLRRYQEQGFALFAYDYRGYGTSQGKASEKSSYKDIEAAYACMAAQWAVVHPLRSQHQNHVQVLS